MSKSNGKPKGKQKPKKDPTPRSTARLGAVQALYQMDIAGTDLNDVVEEFSEHRLGAEVDGDHYKDADIEFFEAIIRGVVKHQRDIDPLLDERLATGWRLARIDSIMRAILRSAAFELRERLDVPARVVLNEYIDIANAFFEQDEPKVVNGVLDSLTNHLRPKELGQKAKAGG
ncbi:MAG: transcription antitermination factor NusB [bacterium]|nr:transcription antitermination factor NusB [bacterium]